MDYSQSTCKNYFNLNTNTFYYEPQFNNSINQLNESTENRPKGGFSNETICSDNSFNTTDYPVKQPFYDNFDVTYTNLDDNTHNEDFYVFNNKQFANSSNQLTNPMTNHHTYSTTNIQSDHPISIDQTDLTDSIPFHSTNNQSNHHHLQTPTAQFSNALQPTVNSSINSSIQQTPNQLNQPVSNQTNASQQTTKQLSVNLSMNMTMDIKSMDFKSLNSNQPNQNQSDYNHVIMNDVVNNVANKLVTNFNSNLLSPNGTTQKDSYQTQFCANQANKNQYPFYNQNSNCYYNQRYHSTIHPTYYTNDSSTNHHFLNQYTNNNSFDELAQFKHFNHHIQLNNNNDCYELVNYNQNWTDNNNSLTTLTTSSLSSNNVNSLNSSLGNCSLTSNEINDNDYLINYSNNFLNSISNRSIDDEELTKSKRKSQQLPSSYSGNLENDNNQKICLLKIENHQNKQDSVLKFRSNENALNKFDRNCKEIDQFYCSDLISNETKLDKRIFTINNKNSNLCLICGKSYARPSTLKTHLRTHSNERPYRCSTCYKSFSQAANLTAHNRVHTGSKPFQCYICLRKFSQSSSVKTHARTHTGEKPYKCQICDKAFSDSSTLTKHIRVHSGSKPYQCQLCSLKFSQSGNLNRHMRIHNNFQ